MKGGGDPHAARLLAKWIDGLGCQEVTIATDGAQHLRTGPPCSGAARRRGNHCGRSQPTRRRRSQRRGREGQPDIWRPREDDEGCCGRKCIGRTAGPRLIAWMVRHAAQLHDACSVGTDGFTPFRRLQGRKYGTLLAGFGERVLRWT